MLCHACSPSQRCAPQPQRHAPGTVHPGVPAPHLTPCTPRTALCTECCPRAGTHRRLRAPEQCHEWALCTPGPAARPRSPRARRSSRAPLRVGAGACPVTRTRSALINTSLFGLMKRRRCGSPCPWGAPASPPADRAGDPGLCRTLGRAVTLPRLTTGQARRCGCRSAQAAPAPVGPRSPGERCLPLPALSAALTSPLPRPPTPCPSAPRVMPCGKAPGQALRGRDPLPNRRGPHNRSPAPWHRVPQRMPGAAAGCGAQ